MNQHVNRLEFENKKIPYVGLAGWVRVRTAFAEDLLEDSQMPVAPALGNPVFSSGLRGHPHTGAPPHTVLQIINLFL